MLDKPSFDQVALMAREVVHRYMEEELDAVYLVYNEFKSVMTQRVVAERILPIIEPGQRDIKQAEEMSREEREEMVRAAATAGVSVREADSHEAEEEAKKFGTAEVDYIYDQPPRELLDGLLRQYVASQIYHALIESSAAEQAARMTAMDAATSNASKMIDSLTLTMNRVRQGPPAPFPQLGIEADPRHPRAGPEHGDGHPQRGFFPEQLAGLIRRDEQEGDPGQRQAREQGKGGAHDDADQNRQWAHIVESNRICH